MTQLDPHSVSIGCTPLQLANHSLLSHTETCRVFLCSVCSLQFFLEQNRTVLQKACSTVTSIEFQIEHISLQWGPHGSGEKKSCSHLLEHDCALINKHRANRVIKRRREEQEKRKNAICLKILLLLGYR